MAQGYLKVLAFGGKVGHCESQGLRDMLPKRPGGSCEETVCKDPEPAGVGVVGCGRRDAANN